MKKIKTFFFTGKPMELKPHILVFIMFIPNIITVWLIIDKVESFLTILILLLASCVGIATQVLLLTFIKQRAYKKGQQDMINQIDEQFKKIREDEQE